VYARRQFCADLEVYRPPEPLWNPRLREAATTLAARRTAQWDNKVKNWTLKDMEKHTEFSKSYTNSIDLKQQQLIEMTKERNDLQKVFDKYGYDIINDKDDYRIINFGNECRSALRIRIE